MVLIIIIKILIEVPFISYWIKNFKNVGNGKTYNVWCNRFILFFIFYNSNMSKDKKILIANLIVSALFLLAVIFALSVYLIYPFPERTKVQDMDSFMIEKGEAFALMTYVVCIPIAIASLITTQVLTIVLAYRLFASNTRNDMRFSSDEGRKWFIVGVILSIILPPLFIWTILFPLIKFTRFQRCYQYIYYGEKSKVWKIIILLPLVFFYPIVATSSLLFVNKKQLLYNEIPIRQVDLKDSYTLSRNKQNTLVLFFDRAFGTHVYKLLALDYCFFNKENGIINPNGTSFAELFPEFTYYINTLSSGDITNFSVSTIHGSWNYDVSLKSTTLVNPSGDFVNNEIGQSDWLYNSHKSGFTMLSENNYYNIGSIGFPYYGNTTWHHNSNSGELENRLRASLNNNHINIFDETEAAKTLDKNITFGIYDDLRIINNLGANKKSISGIVQKDGSIQFAPDDLNTNAIYLNNPYGANEQLDLIDNPEHINLSVDPQKDSTYLMVHTGVTHQPYAYVSNPDFITPYNVAGINYDNPSIGNYEGPSSRYELACLPKDDIFYSEWWMLQKIKDILIYLKNLPYTGNDAYINNQYDNTNIYIISDHGNLINNDINSFNNKINCELVKNNLITEENYLEQLKYSDQTELMQKCSSIFFRKPRKSPFLNKPTTYATNKDYLKNLFNFNDFISIADLMPIIEADVQQANFESSHHSEPFVFDYLNSYYTKVVYPKVNSNMNGIDKEAYDTLVKGVLSPNPLGVDKVSWMSNRQISLVYAYSWKHLPNSKEYPLSRIYKIDQSKLIRNTNSFVMSSYLNPNIYQVIYNK